MMGPLTYMVSYYRNMYDEESQKWEISEIMKSIGSSELEKLITEIRNEPDKEKRNLAKRKLPAVTISGTFGQRRTKDFFLVHSGLIQVDLDNLDNPKLLKGKLENDPYTFAVFLSPSGTGLKVIVRIKPDANHHQKLFYHLEAYYFTRYKLLLDPSCKDLTRLMFLSYDPEIFVNESAKLFDSGIILEQELLFVKGVKRTNLHSAFISSTRNIYIFKLACVCREMQIQLNDCILLCCIFAEHDFSSGEIKTTVASAYKATLTESDSNNSFNGKSSLSLLHIRSARECIEDAARQPIPTMLFSELWHEKEVSILFADTGVGKSILAVQIAQSIASGIPIPGFLMEASSQPVLYLDFELADKQFQKRYSADYQHNYQFHPNCHRVVIDQNCTEFENFEDQLFQELETAVTEKGFKVIIVDNISFLKAESTEKAKDAMPLMKRLIGLKRRHDVSILVLAHTPKRDLRRQISLNDLAGSKHLSNFSDSIFSIGLSAVDPSIRYLKQLKARTTENFYGEDNIIVCAIEKVHNFLGFAYCRFDYEQNHLKAISQDENASQEAQIILLHKENPALSYEMIARQVGTYKMKVSRVISKYKNDQS